MKLRYNPYQIFVSSKTPAGLYARKKWLEEPATISWKHDYVVKCGRRKKQGPLV